jgi:hypothetical protein
MRVLGLGSVVAIVGVAGVGAASTLRSGGESTVTTSEGTVSTPAKSPVKTARVNTPKSPAVVQQSAPAPVTVSPAPVTAAPEATVPPRPATRGGFVLVEGKTQLSDSVYAIRTGDSVIVNFDAYGYRTRRSAKFENSLRETLPMVFGKMATASLDTIAAGSLVTNRDVVGALAGEGMPITLSNGASVRIKVLTRVVTDGPIAIGYLTIIER